MIARLIPTRVHGVLDYLFGVMYIVLPLLLNWPQPAATILMVLGAGVLLYSILTRYELGLLKLLPMPVHLVIDLLGGLLLILLPTFGLVDPSVRNWFWALGAVELIIALVSDTHPHFDYGTAPAGMVTTPTTGTVTAPGTATTATSAQGSLTPSSAPADAYNSRIAMTGLHTGMAEGDKLNRDASFARDSGPDHDARLDSVAGGSQGESVNRNDGMGGGDGYAREGLTEVGITPGGQVVTTNADPQPLPDDAHWVDANRNEAVGSYGETPATREDAQRIDRSRMDVNR